MKSIISQSIAVASFLVLTACGSQVATESTIGLSSTASSTITTATPTATPGNIYNLPSAPTYTAKINGVGGAVPTYVSPAISTSRTLKVKVSPLSAPNMTLAGYEGFVFPYGCLQLQVTVNGVTQTTSVLRVSGVSSSSTSQCSSADTSQTLDFDADITGNGTVNVTVSNAAYDNCRAWGNSLIYGCSMSAMFMNHVAAATIQIESDGTYMAE